LSRPRIAIVLRQSAVEVLRFTNVVRLAPIRKARSEPINARDFRNPWKPQFSTVVNRNAVVRRDHCVISIRSGASRMSNRANRSFAVITADDLKHLAQLALSNFDDFFTRNPSHPYLRRLRLICLLQTAAKHFVEPDKCLEPNQRWGGVNDFDVCGFFQAIPGRFLYPQRKCTMDFGPSKFGHHPEDEGFTGRRVDVMWRSIKMQPSETPIESVQRYLRNAPPKSSAGRYWTVKPVVVLWPSEHLGQVIWRRRKTLLEA
jgi:hypothetical protein